MLTNILYVIGAVYLFDENATTYTLISMALANFAVFVQVGLRFGFPRLISEYITLLLTFADNTGGAVRQMELHDMVYGWGTYVVYYMIHPSFKGEKNIWKFIVPRYCAGRERSRGRNPVNADLFRCDGGGDVLLGHEMVRKALWNKAIARNHYHNHSCFNRGFVWVSDDYSERSFY